MAFEEKSLKTTTMIHFFSCHPIRRVLSLLFLFAALPTWAQSQLDSIQKISEVIITAKPYKEIIPTQQLSGKQLQLLNTHSVADAVRYFSGVQLKDYGGMGGLKTVNVRNMGSHHVGVFYDGIEIGNAQNGTVDLGRYSLDDLESIALYNGQKSEIFQSAKDFASSSSIYLKAKRPSFKEGEKRHLLARYKAGSIQLVNPSFRWEEKINQYIDLSLSGEYLQSDGKYKFRYKRNNLDGSIAYDTTATRKNSDIEAYRMELGLYGKIKNGQWEGKLYFYQSDRGLPGAIVKNKFKSGERIVDKNFFAQASVLKQVNERYKFKINGKFAYDYTHYRLLDTTDFLGEEVNVSQAYDNTYRQQDIYLSAINMYSLTNIWDLSLSTDLQYNTLDVTQKNNDIAFAYPKRYTLMAALASSLNLGKLKAQASLLGIYVTEQVKNGSSSPDRQELSPMFIVGYKPFAAHKLNLRAYYKHIFRMPTFNDLYYTQIGSSQLEPEQTNQFNVGFTYEKHFQKGWINRIALQADIYYADITNKIIASPTGSSFRWMMSNMGKVESKGIDASIQVDASLSKWKLHTQVNYSYGDARNHTRIDGKKLSSYGAQIPYAPWHSGTAIFGADYCNWSLNYSFIYVGKRYNGAENNIPKNQLQPWYTHDLSLQKTLIWKNKQRIKAAVEVNNLFNQYYDVVLNYPMPGRNFKFTISISI